MSDQKRCLSYCNRCNHPTHHDVLHRQETYDQEIDHSNGTHEEWTYTHTMLQCRGCEDVSMRIDHWHSGYGEDEPELYPPRISRKSPAWLWKLPSDWWSLLREIYGALHADSRRLAMMGARTVIDLYLTEAVGNTGSFENRLDLLVSSGKLATDDKATLKAALEAGNATAHRGHIPNYSDLNSVMDIVEHLLHGFVIKQSTEDLQNNTPPRPKS